MNDCIRRIDDIRAFGVDEAVESFLERLGGPTAFRVPGRDRSRTRAVTTLLHGNEPSGVRAVHAWLRSDVAPETDVIFYIGSVEAALRAPRFTTRFLPASRDANRTFREPFTGREGRCAEELLRLLAGARPEALVDLHNNSGHSPAYGVGIAASPAHLALTGLFADRFMLTDLRLGTLIEATEPFTPSVVIECGRAGDAVADAVALAGLERLLSVEDVLRHRAEARSIRVLQRPVRVMLAPSARLAFAPHPVSGVDVTLRPDLDRHNFETVAAGVEIGWLGPERPWPFEARGGDGREVSQDLFAAEGGVLVTRRSMVPIMMTVSSEQAKLDCLFYAMEIH